MPSIFIRHISGKSKISEAETGGHIHTGSLPDREIFSTLIRGKHSEMFL